MVHVSDNTITFKQPRIINMQLAGWR